MSTKFPKARLKEELDKRKKFGATWEWKSTNLGNGRYSAICEFYLEAGSPPVTGNYFVEINKFSFAVKQTAIQCLLVKLKEPEKAKD